MKIGIVTVYDSANFGSYLQSYALHLVLSEMGHEVYFISNPTPDKPYKRNFYKYPVNRNSLRHPISVWREYLAGREKCRIFSSELKRFNVLDFSQADQMDKIILGSDEIWNVTMPYFTNPFFYGEGMRNVYTYAVSMGKATADDYAAYPGLRENMSRIAHLLVRDQHTADVVKEMTGHDSTVVCDPTFLVDVEKFHKELNDDYLKNNRYLLIYSYPGYITDEFKNNVISFARENNLKIVSACFYLDWCDYVINCSQLEFCEVLKLADYVVTTTFHGSIFSILNHKRFLSMPSGIKVTDIVTKLGLSHALIDSSCDSETFKRKLSEDEYDYESVEQRIMAMRKQGLEELSKILQQ